METAKKIISRIANENTLYSITYNQFTLVGCQNLSKRGRRYLSYFISVVKCGYDSIEANANVLADSIYRAQGQTKSVRTLQYALSELEENGFITRKKYRIGINHYRTVIKIHIEKFSYWTGKKYGNISPIHTNTYNSSYMQNMQIDDRRNQNSVLNSQNSYLNEHNKQHACTRSKQYANFKYHPIIFTLMMILKNSPNRNKILSTAYNELSGISNNSGIDWERWDPAYEKWQKLPIFEREGIAKVDFLPRLKQTLNFPVANQYPGKETVKNEFCPSFSRSHLSCPPQSPSGSEFSQMHTNIVPEGDILQLIQNVIKNTDNKEKNYNKVEIKSKIENMELTKDELDILLRARERIKNCR